MIRFNPTRAAVAACCLAVLPIFGAEAHVTLATREAPVFSHYKAVLQVPHGCDGAATTAIKVSIPTGVFFVKPMPKPGWQLATVEVDYPEPHESHGRKVTRGVSEITWSGGVLPDAWYDEFTFVAALPDRPAGTVLYFPVVQTCERGEKRWTEIPARGAATGMLPLPAPSLTLTAPSPAP